MTEQMLVPGSMTAEPGPPAEPRPPGGRWRSAVFLLALMAGLVAATLLVVTLAPSAGAAGGCGGG
jgi:hypothetical protein